MSPPTTNTYLSRTHIAKMVLYLLGSTTLIWALFVNSTQAALVAGICLISYRFIEETHPVEETRP